MFGSEKLVAFHVALSDNSHGLRISVPTCIPTWRGDVENIRRLFIIFAQYSYNTIYVDLET